MSDNLPLISINGVLNAALSPLDRGFAYGDGVFETCRYKNGSIPLWQYHCERLLKSAERLGISLDEQLLLRYRDELLAQKDVMQAVDGVLKITVTRGVGGRGYRITEALNPTYCLVFFRGNVLHTEQYLTGISVRICNLRLSQNPILAGMKHLNRLEHILARAEWKDEFAEGLLLDTGGSIIEATVSNLFIVKNNQLFTPDLANAGVAGVMRRLIIERLAPALNLDITLVHMDLDFIAAADEIFLCNSVYGIWPVNDVVDDRQLIPIQYAYHQHHITRILQQQLEQYLNKMGGS